MAQVQEHPHPEPVTLEALCARHAAVLLDAYGVLVDARGAIPHAVEAVQWLEATRTPYLVVTNDASRSAERASQRFRRLGIPVPPERVLSSGMMIAPALREFGVHAGRVVVLGTGDSRQYAADTGAEVVAPSVEHPADAVVVADEGGFDLLDTMDETLSMIVAAHRAGRTPRLFVANPDLIYPSAQGRYGFTAGSLAGMLERALALLIPRDPPRFVELGKPSPRIFEEALRRVGTRDCAMIGDQDHTDVAGAAGVGIAPAIVLTGVTPRDALGARARYVLEDLRVAPRPR